MGLLRRIGRGLSKIRALDKQRLACASAFIMPWEWPTLYGIPSARHYPRFQRGHDNEAQAVRDMLAVAPYTMTKYDRCATLHNQVKFLEERQIPGDLVECGVWRGGSMGMMALAHRRYGRLPRQLRLFDAWGDWPDPTPDDGLQYRDLLAGTLVKADNRGALAACRELLESVVGFPPERIHYEQGLFGETIPRAAPHIEAIALLRLDGDWYESTKLALAHLFPKVAPGGIVVIDDYGSCDGCRRAVDEFLVEYPLFLHYVDYSCRYVFKPAEPAA